MCRAYDNVFGLMKSEYSRAVEDLTGDNPEDESERPEVHLGEHILVLTARGLVSSTDPDDLFYRFFKKSNDLAAAHALATVGQWLRSDRNDVSPGVIERFKSMWGTLMELGKDPGRSEKSTKGVRLVVRIGNIQYGLGHRDSEGCHQVGRRNRSRFRCRRTAGGHLRRTAAGGVGRASGTAVDQTGGVAYSRLEGQRQGGFDCSPSQ